MFANIKKQIQDQFSEMIKGQSVLFITDLDKDLLWNTYIDSFTDPAKKQEYTCNCCRSFIRNYANVVVIKNNSIVTIWDFVSTDEHKDAVDNMRDLVTKSIIKDIFISDTKVIGTDKNVQLYEKMEDKQVLLKTPITWNHFSLELPLIFVNSRSASRESIMGDARGNKDVFKRSLNELTQDSVETVLELIGQNSLYKGDENKGVLTEFLKHKKAYDKASNKDNYAWVNSYNAGHLAKIRNTSIGTLLIDLSEGKELDKAVEAFERVVAPQNYKRPTALVTKKMIEEAERLINELGYTDSLERRCATSEDVSINDLLFVDRNVKKAKGVFEEMKENVLINPKTLKKVEEIHIDDFVMNILPTARNIQLLFENGHLNNLVSLITAKNEAPNLFKWNNPFSWSYTNAVTDSIKEQVKAAGGKVEGELRISLSWFNYDDLDLHIIEPSGRRIYYGDKVSPITGGHLDVDMNAHSGKTRKAVENVIYTNENRISEGIYKVFVRNFCQREAIDTGFIIEIECRGEISTFAFDKSPRNNSEDEIVQFSYSKKDGIKLSKESKNTVISKDKWGVATQKFHKVSMIMNSPNFWNDQKIGNKHTFFMLEGAKNDENARGLFNEFLKPELEKHRKVFEVLGSKLKVQPADKQLSGVGFSSTQRNSVICKVEGKFERLLKINF